MSINNIDKNMPGTNKSVFAGGSRYFNEKTGTYEESSSDTSFYGEPKLSKLIEDKYSSILPNIYDLAFKEEYYIPLPTVRNEINSVHEMIGMVVNKIDLLLNNINVDYLASPALEEAHKALWREVVKYNNITTEEVERSDEKVYVYNPYFNKETNKYYDPEEIYPEHISFEEYLYARRSESTVAKRFIKEYNKVCSHSVFSYLIELRNFLEYMLNESYNIKNILTTIFKGDYEDDAQKQIGVQFDAWSKVAMHYTQRVEQAIISRPGEIPSAELDKISEKQTVEFQAFFSIRLDAINEEVIDILDNLKNDFLENSNIFYERYLYQSLKFKREIVSSMELDFYTTTVVREMPVLAGELVIATNVMNANFGMILTDLIQRNTLINKKADNFFNLINEKRKYSNYIFQLSFKGTKKKQIVTTVTGDHYSGIFKNSENKLKYESDLISNHGSLNNLLENHHPQYLLKDGGTITGDIFVENGARIQGVEIGSHAHTGSDGSAKIRSTDIDYSSPRDESEITIDKPYSVTIDSYVSDIIDGGIPVMDVILSIETGSASNNQNIEYEISISEVD
jgi:hypothetical protein